MSDAFEPSLLLHPHEQLILLLWSFILCPTLKMFECHFIRQRAPPPEGGRFALNEPTVPQA